MKGFLRTIKHYTELNKSAEVTSYCQKTTERSGFEVTYILIKRKNQQAFLKSLNIFPYILFTSSRTDL